MIFLFEECDDKKCSYKNVYNEEYGKLEDEFYKKYAKEIDGNVQIKRNGVREIERLIKVTKEKFANIQDNIDVIKLANLEQKLYN